LAVLLLRTRDTPWFRRVCVTRWSETLEMPSSLLAVECREAVSRSSHSWAPDYALGGTAAAAWALSAEALDELAVDASAREEFIAIVRLVAVARGRSRAATCEARETRAARFWANWACVYHHWISLSNRLEECIVRLVGPTEEQI